jgi:hypothetical protein
LSSKFKLKQLCQDFGAEEVLQRDGSGAELSTELLELEYCNLKNSWRSPFLQATVYQMGMAIMAPPVPDAEEDPRLPMPSRNPLPLSAAQEAQVRDLYYSRVRGYCASEIKGECLDILICAVNG